MAADVAPPARMEWPAYLAALAAGMPVTVSAGRRKSTKEAYDMRLSLVTNPDDPMCGST